MGLSKTAKMARDTAFIDESLGAGKKVPPPLQVHVRPAKDPRLVGITRPKDAAIIPVDRISPDPDQPRKDFDQLGINRLADSLKARGQLQPIGVRWSDEGSRYVVVYGERRWKAAVVAELPTLHCRIFDRPMPQAELRVIQMVENCAREDLSPLEQANAMKDLIELNEWNQSRLAYELGVAQSVVSRSLALLDLPETLKYYVSEGTLSPSVARELARVGDSPALGDLTGRAIREEWTRVEASAAARAAIDSPNSLVYVPDIKPGSEVAQEAPADLAPPADPNSFGYSPGNNSGAEVAEEEPEVSWIERDLVEDGELSAKAIERARFEGVTTFGQLEARFRMGGNSKKSFQGEGAALWASLNWAKLRWPEESPSPLSRALPDWRDRPAMGLGLPSHLADLLADCSVETAGEAWGLLVSGWFTSEADWDPHEAKQLQDALAKIRERAGDPAVFLPVIPAAPRVAQPAGEGRDVPKRKLFQEGAVHISEPRPAGPAWGQFPFSPDRKLVISELNGVAIWAVAQKDSADILVLAGLRDAVAVIEARLGR